MAWMEAVEEDGLEATRRLPSFHDEPRRGSDEVSGLYDSGANGERSMRSARTAMLKLCQLKR
jgi:hypothetical protein